MEHATGLSRERQLAAGDSVLDAEEARRLETLVARRAAREPMAHIRGTAHFWDLELAVGPGALIPRPETETLIEAALDAFLDRATPLRILDLGVGSGCLVLTLLHLFRASVGTGLDISPTALACARDNATRLGLAARLTLVHGDWRAAPAGPFDLIVANPPYVAEGELAALQPEVREHEPRLALRAGPDGLDAYRALLPEAARRLAQGGVLLLELGLGQADAVTALAAATGLRVAGIRADLAGVPRCLAARV
jgi:release factor glutamine methyltransferase